MRIAIVIEGFDPAVGGAERSTDRIARGLAQRGHDVTIVAGGAPPNDTANGLAVRRWRGARKPRTGGDARAFRAWAIREIRGGDFDTSLSVTTLVPADFVQPRAGVVRESMERSLAATRGALARRWRRLGQVLSPRKWSLLRAEAETFRDPQVRTFVAISRSMQAQMERHYGVPASRIALVPNASDSRPVAAPQREEIRCATRADRGWDRAAHILLFPALDARRKGLAPLLDAVALLAANDPSLRLAVAGRMPPWATRRAAALGIAARIDAVGIVADVRDLYVAADCTVMPTYYDPASRVVVESLLAGTPVVTTRYDGSADRLGEAGPDAGCVIDDPDDTAGLAEAIRTILDRAAPPLQVDAAALSMDRHIDILEQLLTER